jgi:hypothetical protein
MTVEGAEHPFMPTIPARFSEASWPRRVGPLCYTSIVIRWILDGLARWTFGGLEAC